MANLKAHLVMRSIEVEGLAESLASSIKAKGSCDDPSILSDIAKKITDRLNGYVTAYGSAPDVKRRREAETTLLRQAKEAGTESDVTQLNLHETMATVDFAQSLGSNFPGGVHISGNEVVDILELFSDSPQTLNACRDPSKPAPAKLINR